MADNDPWFHHPDRLPANAAGPFYTTGRRQRGGRWCGDCLACEVPEDLAPGLLAPLSHSNTDTFFVRQPTTPDEVASACAALTSCCVDALRYGGQDPEILGALPARLCDYRVSRSGRVVRNHERTQWKTELKWGVATVLVVLVLSLGGFVWFLRRCIGL